MPFFFSPVGNAQFVDANGNPLAGGKIHTYLAGSTTPASTYTSNVGTTAQANPIVLNALGMPASPIWLDGDLTYKFVLTTAADVTLFTVDNVVGVNDPQEDFSQWVTSGLTPTYINATSFSVPGNETATLQVNRRIEYTLNGGTYYGYISSSTFALGVTTVVVAPDATNLDATLSSFRYGFVSATNTSIPQQYVLAAVDKVPARSALTLNALLSNDGTTPNWSELKIVVQTISASGTYTPTPGMVAGIAELNGGGAGGAQLAAGSVGGAGGNAGEYARCPFTAADIGASKPATIGAGGAVNGAGGVTSLGTIVTAAGASASTTQIPPAATTGGTGTCLHVPGEQGQTGSGAYTGPQLIGGQGGSSKFGSGGRGGTGNIDAGAAGAGYGSGGGGNGLTGGSWGTAGVGKAGVIVITEYVLDPV